MGRHPASLLLTSACFGEILGGGNPGSTPLLRAAKLRPLRTIHLPAPSSSGARAPSPQAAHCLLCIPHMAVGSPLLGTHVLRFPGYLLSSQRAPSRQLCRQKAHCCAHMMRYMDQEDPALLWDKEDAVEGCSRHMWEAVCPAIS